MPSEKAKENKTLSSACAACGQAFSTELLTGIVVGVAPHRRLVPVCQRCLEQGWAPPAEPGHADRAKGAAGS